MKAAEPSGPEPDEPPLLALTEAEHRELDGILAELFLPTFTARERSIAIAVGHAFIARQRQPPAPRWTAERQASIEQAQSKIRAYVVSEANRSKTFITPALITQLQLVVTELVVRLDADEAKRAWQPMATAPRLTAEEFARPDRPWVDVLLKFKLGLTDAHGSLQHWSGKQMVGHWTPYGWNFAGPTGYGGFGDDDFEGWRPLPLERAR